MSDDWMIQDEGRIRTIRASLLQFFDEVRRDLPWRESIDPYRIWVSEVMLQQTRVATVVPYYRRWIERFPTVDALAGAPSEEVLRLWQGLGYYSRARNLHRAARLVVDEFDGVLPETRDELKRLPGIGDYTSGAVASIAFGAPVPAVDGNVRRVLARLADDPDPTPARLRRWAGALVDPERPGDFNQALMELGALVCTPRSPECGRCPLEAECRARAAGTQESRPRPKPRGRVRHAVAVSLVLCREVGSATEVLLERQPEEGLLGGMWSTPTLELPAETDKGSTGTSATPAARRTTSQSPPGTDPSTRKALYDLLRRTLDEVGLATSPFPTEEGGGTAPSALPPVDHAFTHLRVRYLPFRVRAAAVNGVRESPPRNHFRWVRLAARDAVPLPVAQESILALLESEIGEDAKGGGVP